MSKPIAAEPSTASRSKFTLLVLLGFAQLVLVASLGCRSTTDNQIDLLERELRVQEDYIYELEDYVVEYSEKLRDCRSCPPQQTASYSEEVYEPEPAPKRSKQSTRRRREQEESPQETEDEQTPKTSPENLEVPDEIEFELGDPISDTEVYQQQIQPAAFEEEYESTEEDEGELMIPSPLDYLDSPEQEGFEEEDFRDEPNEAVFVDEQVEETTAAVIRVVERLEVTRLFQGEGDQLSPQNLLAVVEALDANDEPVDLDGEVSMMIMTTDEATPKRLKRWNFTASETTDAWQSSDLGDGLHLELPLEKLQLPAAPLEIWVRLVTSDGRKLLTKLPFEPGQLSDIADHSPPPHPHGLVLAETETEIESEATPVNSLRMSTSRSLRMSTSRDSLNQNEKLADSKESVGKPRWRASMQRTDRTSEGFATSAGKSSGWTKQSPGRQQYVYPRIVLPARTQQAIKPASKPVWTSGRTILPTSSTTTSR